MNITIVIVSYNAMRWLPKTLGRVNDYRVILVDNASTDESISYAVKEFPSVTVIENNMNLGFGAANNQGIRKALELGATHIFLLNQDAWIQCGSLERLVDLLEQNKHLGLVSPVHYDGSGKTFDFGFKEYLKNDPENSFLVDIEIGDTKEYYPVKFVNAAAWMIPSRVFKEIGLFHPAFFHYGEDDEFINRLRRHGYEIGICPDVAICHDRPQTRSNSGHFSDWERMKRRYLIEVFNHNSPKDNFRKLKKSLLKSATYQFARFNWGKAIKYLKIISYLSGRIKTEPNPVFP